MITGLYPSLKVKGSGKEAVEFYKEALNAEVLGLTTFKEVPDDPDFPIPTEAEDLILEARLKVGNFIFTVADTFPDTPFNTGSHQEILLMVDTEVEARMLYEKLASGNGQTIKKLQGTSRSPLAGSFVDRYGIRWQIFTDIGEG